MPRFFAAALLATSLLTLPACQTGEVRDIGASGTGVASDRSGDGPAAEAGLPHTDPAPRGNVPEMNMNPDSSLLARGAFVVEGTIRREASGAWLIETDQRAEPYELVGLPAAYQKDGLRTKVRLEASADAPATQAGRQAARVVEVGDAL